jgi:hypothetical protein
MKRFVIYLTVFLFWGGLFSVYAQDLIVLRDGNMIDAKVTEISPTEIRYKRASHLDGPTIVVLAPYVLSIRYANGKVDIINPAPPAAAVAGAGSANPAGAAVVADAAAIAGAAGLPGAAMVGAANDISLLQEALNRLPAIPVAGKTIKLVFAGETWRGQINGADALSGTLNFQAVEGGGVIVLKPTHAYLRGRQIPAPASEIFLEYKAGPPMSLRTMSKADVAAAGVTSGSAIVLANGEWQTGQGPGCTVRARVNQETIDGQEVDVLAMEANVKQGGWAVAANSNAVIVEQLRNATGVRLKALGDGKPWQLVINMPETNSDGGSYRAEIRTRKGRVVEIDIPFSKLKQPQWGKRVKFNRDSISGMGIERGSHQGVGATSIKVFDIEVY